MMGLAVVAQVALGDAPNFGQVYVRGMTYGGSGCPSGSVASLVSPDNAALTMLFDSYVVDTSTSPAGLDQKACTVRLELEGPPGWEYSLYTIDYHGYADLQEGTSGAQSSSYSFGTGAQKTDLGAFQIQGPFNNDYTHSTSLPLAAAGWSRCGQPKLPLLNLETRVVVQSRPTQRQVALSSGGGRYSEMDLGAPLSNITLVKKDSASPCTKGFSFGLKGTKAWVNYGCRGSFNVDFVGNTSASRPHGTMTVDSLDGYVNQEYGIAWRRCLTGKWIQTEGRLCADVCKQHGMTAGKDPAGASCVSGETRPGSATGAIKFTKGCWGGCTSQGDLANDTLGPFCYAKGQTKDADLTDFTVGCYCK